MTYELLAYLCMFIVTLLIAGLHGKWAKLAMTLVVIGYIITVRLSPWDADILNYALTMAGGLQVKLINPYYLKEWFYWITSSWLYEMGLSELAVFLFFDAIALYAITKIKAPPYFIGLAFLMFPSVLGLQNVHRQFVATCLLLLAVQSIGKRRWLIFSLSVFSHNSAALFGPLLLKNRWLMLLGAIAVILLLPFVVGSKSSSDTGANLTLAYAALLLLIPLIAIFIRKGKIAKDIFYPLFYSFVITVAAAALLGSSQAERVGMISLFMAVPHIIYYIENHVSEKWAARALLIVILSLPSLIFPAPLAFLQSQ